MARPPRFSIELDRSRRKRWQAAADLAVPDRERNLAAWLGPVLDAAADLQAAGGDPFDALRTALEELTNKAAPAGVKKK
jgi:hypothetical protein